MKFINISFLLMLLSLAGCHKIHFNNEFACIQKTAYELTGEEIQYQRSLLPCLDEKSEKLLEEGLTRHQAIGLAVRNNPELQALFESIGIAKADLEQAGLYTNPDAHAFLWPPLKGKKMELETGTFFHISDLWQVPFKKEVQKDVLESVKFKILESILEIIKETQIAYDKVLFVQNKLEALEDIVKQAIHLRDNIHYYQSFGLQSDLEKHFAQVTVSNAELEVVNAQNELAQAYLDLKKLIGIPPTIIPIKLTDQFDGYVEKLKLLLPSLEELQEWALTYRPEILNAHMKIKQYNDMITLEKSRILSSVNAGVSFKRDFDGSYGIGPNIELLLPVFDQNQAQIARAEFLLNQAKKELFAVQLEIQKQVQQHYFDFIFFEKEIGIFKNDLLHANNEALSYTEKYEQVMQITMITLLQTRTALYQNKVRSLKVYYHALKSFTQLERAVGKRITINSYNLVNR